MVRYVIRRLVTGRTDAGRHQPCRVLPAGCSTGRPDQPAAADDPTDVRENIRESLGFNDPALVQWIKWLKLMVVNEPLYLLDAPLDKVGVCIGDCFNHDRVISWQSRSPAMDNIYQKIPHTSYVLGLGLIFGVLIAVPIGTMQAYRQYSWFDNVGTLVTMIGFSVPVFVLGPLFIWLFSINLGWFPTIYKSNHEVDWTSWSSIWIQIEQLIMPVAVLTLFNAAQFGRFTRASVLENLNQSYVRTARAKGLGEGTVLTRHVLRNSLIPVVTLLALSIPGSSAERSSPRASSASMASASICCCRSARAIFRSSSRWCSSLRR